LVLVQIRRCNETKKGIPVGNKGGIPFGKVGLLESCTFTSTTFYLPFCI